MNRSDRDHRSAPRRCARFRRPATGSLPVAGTIALCLCLCLCLLIPRAWAYTYYVAVNDPNAADTNDGTAARPFLHILKANVVAEAGDTVVVRPGIYHDTISPHNSGNAGAWITYVSEQWHAAVLDGRIPLEDVVDTTQADWEPTCTDPDTNIWCRLLIRSDFTEAWRDGERMPCPFKYYHGAACGPWHMEQGRSVVRNDSLYVWLAPGETPADFTWEVSINHGVWIDTCYVRVEGFVVQRYGLSGIAVTHDNVVIRDNLSQHNGRSGIGVLYCGREPVRIEDNVARYNNEGIGFSQGITTYNATGSQIYFRRNISHNNFDGGPCGSDGNGFVVDSSEPDGGATLVNNVAFLNAGAGFGIYQSSHVNLVNNTSFNNLQKPNTTWGAEIHIGGTDSIGCNDILLRNNIMAVAPGATKSSQRRSLNITYHEAHPPVDVHIDHNLHFRWPDSDAETPLVGFTWRTSDGQEQGTVLNLAEYQAFSAHGLSNLGEGAVFASPLLVDYTYGNFRLQAGSPAIDAGSSESAPATDFFGQPRTYGTGYDIGAYEYVGLVNTPDGPPARPLHLSCYPNPANPIVTVRYELKRPADASLRVFDMEGRLLRTLVVGRLEAGLRTLTWDGRDDAGRFVGTGVYLMALTAGADRRAVKVVLVR